jgi:hypothetical protein
MPILDTWAFLQFLLNIWVFLQIAICYFFFTLRQLVSFEMGIYQDVAFMGINFEFGGFYVFKNEGGERDGVSENKL